MEYDQCIHYIHINRFWGQNKTVKTGHIYGLENDKLL